MVEASMKINSTDNVRVSDYSDFIEIPTPAFVYDEAMLMESVGKLKDLAEQVGGKVLFALKSFTLVDALYTLSPFLHGFAASSLFEARLGRNVLGRTGSLHITTPALTPSEINDISETCDYISFNSLPQWHRFRETVGARVQCGLRINPQLSFVEDERYDPCRKHSKLGVPLDFLKSSLNSERAQLDGISGIHFHTNCESTSLSPLLSTVRYLDQHIPNLLGNIQWVNMGGGYQYDEAESFEPFFEAVTLLRRKYGLEVFIEPGQAIVGKAGYLISTVLDIFDCEGKTLAILDTAINHMPQVYEYQYQPEILNISQSGAYTYLLAGATCLAGDLFGEYKFDHPLAVGSKIIFKHMGAYTLVRAHTFNGINLPDVYALNPNRRLILKKRYIYEEYLSKWKTHV